MICMCVYIYIYIHICYRASSRERVLISRSNCTHRDSPPGAQGREPGKPEAGTLRAIRGLDPSMLLFLRATFVLYYTITYYTLLYSTILYYTILYYIILYYTNSESHDPGGSFRAKYFRARRLQHGRS